MPKPTKELGFIGLESMGLAMAQHLAKDGFAIEGFDESAEIRKQAQEAGVKVHASLTSCLEALPVGNRIVFVTVPQKRADGVLTKLKRALKKGDCVIDASNSFFKESVFRQYEFDGMGIDFVDCGVSGGVDEAALGVSLMVGGETQAVKRTEHIFSSLAVTDGYGYVGGPGAGHFVKMIQDGIEYGMIGAIAEGINALHEHRDGMHLNIKEAIKAYEHGSIIEGHLISWLSDVYEEKGVLGETAGKVPKGETEPEMEYLVDHNHLRVLSAALTQRKLTRIEPSFTGTLIAALRNEFGGHKAIDKKRTGKHQTEDRS